ncbi:MAG: DUF3043 domain-containing protein [Galactobacter sp.]
MTTVGDAQDPRHVEVHFAGRMEGVFGSKKKQSEAPAAEVTPPEDFSNRNPDGSKKGPTPKRKQQEAARQRPLVSSNRTEAKARDKQRRIEEQAKIRRGMQTGEEQYLPARDRGPQKRFARNFSDARTCLAEFFFPVILIYFIVAIGFSSILSQSGQVTTTLMMYVVILILILDMFVTWRALKKAVIAKFGEVERGVLWYGTFRTIQMRFMRQPKAQVKRGAKLD